MSCDATTVRLDEIVNFKTGRLDSNAAEDNGQYPFFTCSPTTLSINDFAFDDEAVILAGNNANGVFPVKYYRGKFNAYQRTYVITPQDKERVDVRWLYFQIKQVTSDLQKLSVGSATKFLTKKILDAYEINLPRIDVQRAIAKILWDIENKIELNRQINQTLEEMAQALFKSWFVDFEPVKAKMAAKERWRAMQPVGEFASPACSAEQPEPLPALEDYMNLAAMQAISGKTAEQLQTLKTQNPDQYQQLQQTAQLFPDAMQDSELGEIPEGWEVTKIGEIVKRLKANKRYTKKQVRAFGKIPVFEQGSSILMGFHDETAGFNATPEDPIFIFGDHTCVTHLSCTDFDISSNVIPVKGAIRPTVWTYYAILGKQKFQEYRRHWSEFVIKDIVLPPLDLSELFTIQVTQGYLMIESLNSQNKQLEAIRDGLLPKLLSGELEV